MRGRAAASCVVVHPAELGLARPDTIAARAQRSVQRRRSCFSQRFSTVPKTVPARFTDLTATRSVEAIVDQRVTDAGDGFSVLRRGGMRLCEKISRDQQVLFEAYRPRFQNGPEIDDFWPVFIGTLVGVGCRMTVVGPRLGTRLGTLQPTPMCASQAHVVSKE
jgi:hypothetical protein